MGRDLIVRTGDLDFVAHDVEHAATLQARRLPLVDEAHGHFNANEALLANAQEVDVDRLVLDRIELKIARYDVLLRTINVDFENC